LGRAAGNDVVFDDLKVSREHAILEWAGDGFTLRDLDSANGTYVNDERIEGEAWPLRDQDQIRLGWLAMVYETAPGPEQGGAAEATAAAHPAAPARAASTGASLLVILGPDLGQEYPLWGETITIGRASLEATWEIRLTDRAVSRPHARLERRDQEYLLTDLESANGTLLNGAPLRGEALLKDGDAISMGETTLLFQRHPAPRGD
jgi:pSer/pThr/pTyr-binding forkhead associated (FHA) protein